VGSEELGERREKMVVSEGERKVCPSGLVQDVFSPWEF
jgi:hypothetical protein